MKLCKNCKHYGGRGPEYAGTNYNALHICCRDVTETIDPVDGHMVSDGCVRCDNDGTCPHYVRIRWYRRLILPWNIERVVVTLFMVCTVYIGWLLIDQVVQLISCE